MLFNGASHFIVGSHFMYPVFLFLPQLMFLDYDLKVTLCWSPCLLFFANKETWVHGNPFAHYYQMGWMDITPNRQNLEQMPRVGYKEFGFVFVLAGAGSISFKTTEICVPKDFYLFIYFQGHMYFLTSCILSVMNRINVFMFQVCCLV